MDDSAFHQELVELLGGRAHIFEALSERYDRESHPLKVLGHLHGSPSVKGNLQNMIGLAQLLDDFLDEAIVNDITLGRHQVALLIPDVIWNGCPAHTLGNGILRNPEKREHDVFLFRGSGWEHQHKSRNVSGAGQVQSSITVTAFEGFHIDRLVAEVIDVFRDKPGQRGHPHIQTKLLEHVLLCRVVQCFLVRIPDTLDLDGLAERGIGFIPVGFIVPVILIGQTIDHWVKGVVDLTAIQQIKCFHVQFVANALFIRAGRGDQEEQRLLTGITGTFGKDIVEFSVWLGMYLIQHQTRHVQTVLRANFSRQNLIESCVPVVHDALRSRHDLAPFQKCRGHLHHLMGNIKNDGCLLAVSCSTIDFGRWLVIGKKQI